MVFLKRLDEIQPSQLFINAGKLSQVIKRFDPPIPESLEPVPVKELDGEVIFTDGHTRAFTAFLHGLTEIRVFWDEDNLDWEAGKLAERTQRSTGEIASIVARLRTSAGSACWRAAARGSRRALQALS